MGIPHGEMLARMPASELTEWQAFECESGVLGPERFDALAALVSYYVVRALGGKTEYRRLLPQWSRGGAEDWQSMKATAQTITARWAIHSG